MNNVRGEKDFNLELNLENKNNNSEKSFIPKKSIDISEIDNTESFKTKLDTFSNEKGETEKDNSIINRISGFWAKKENVEKNVSNKEPTFETAEKIDKINIENEENSSELDIIEKDDDKVIEIPAFLRRQVN